MIEAVPRCQKAIISSFGRVLSVLAEGRGEKNVTGIIRIRKERYDGYKERKKLKKKRKASSRIGG